MILPDKNAITQGLTPPIKTVAIIPAGGSGRRMQGSASKQYLSLNGRPILVHTLQRFQTSSDIDAIFLIVPPGDTDDVQRSIVDRYGLSKVTKILPGGTERQDSVRNGLEALSHDVDIVVIHDGVRPFIAESFIRQTILEATSIGATILAVPAKETVKICDTGNRVAFTPDRNRVWLTQTPQAFRREIIIRAYESAYKDNFYGTDDAGLVERIGIAVSVIPGSYDNIKITTPDDLAMAERLIKKEEWS
jgi:2-C-methyl-D-erythritol 4-phosphate cytidylyltransferase